ncbi:hypothetical protein JHK87_042883 [Glycine soja]|nr:hypothetical protein JHK87_042883 [Glycine soja]
MDLHGGSLSTVSTGAQAIPGHSTQDDGMTLTVYLKNLEVIRSHILKMTKSQKTVIATLLLMGFIFIPVGLVALRA